MWNTGRQLKNVFYFGLIFGLALAFEGCSSDPNLEKVEYTYDAKGLQVDLNSAANLNLKDDVPSTLAIAFIQSNDVKAITKLAQNKTELDQLLLGLPSSNPAIISTDRFVVQPAARSSLVMPRRNDVKVVLIYAAYFGTPLAKSVRVLEVPLVKATGDDLAPTPVYLFLNLADTYIDRLNLLGPDDVTFPDEDNEALKGGTLKEPAKADGRVTPL